MKYISANMCEILNFRCTHVIDGVSLPGEVAAMSGPGNGGCAKSIAQNSLPPLWLLPSKLLCAGRAKG